ncbi:VTT domain-containing protein [Actinoplanes sp. NPDC048796]|uniref:DedA family protein n=1 Tax=unclassified Actinoplanes TaxID=2626549 RepID=UPI0033F21DB5
MDLMSLLTPMMTSPMLYPLLVALVGVDGVVPVVPSEAAVLTAGVFARAGTPNLLLVIAAAAVGVFVSDHVVYGLGRTAAGPRLLGRFPRIGRAVAVAGRRIERRPGLLILMSRFLPGGRLATNLACGTARLPLSRFSPASALAAVAWAAYHAGLGVLGGAAFAENPLIGIAIGLGLSSLVGGVVALIRRRPRPGVRDSSRRPSRQSHRPGQSPEPGRIHPARRATSLATTTLGRSLTTVKSSSDRSSSRASCSANRFRCRWAPASPSRSRSRRRTVSGAAVNRTSWTAQSARPAAYRARRARLSMPALTTRCSAPRTRKLAHTAVRFRHLSSS